MTPDRTNAERQRRYRLRQRAGIQVVPCLVDFDAIEVLIASGVISEDAALDRERLGAVIVDLALAHAIRVPEQGQKN